MPVQHFNDEDPVPFTPKIVDGKPVFLGQGADGRVFKVVPRPETQAAWGTRFQGSTFCRKEIGCVDPGAALDKECRMMERLSILEPYRRRHFVTLQMAYSKLSKGVRRYYLISSPVANGGNLFDYLKSSRPYQYQSNTYQLSAYQMATYSSTAYPATVYPSAAYTSTACPSTAYLTPARLSSTYSSSYTLRSIPTQDAWKSNLLKMMHCLVASLASMHLAGVEHHDIHPWNILVHDHEPLYTDFGRSCDFQPLPDSSTTNEISQYYSLYRAPEHEFRERRGWHTDVFALGGVLFEIAAVLTDDQNLKNVRPFENNNRLSHLPILKCARDALLIAAQESPYQKELHVIYQMLDDNVTNRITAEQCMWGLPVDYCDSCLDVYNSCAEIARRRHYGMSG
jgi:serine/threonine protein kinase